MILFYSTFCNHCSMLMEHIKRFDKDKIIKMVSVDELRSKNIKIDAKIHSVPALVLVPSKEVLFGKAVFDHLLLPGRGVLCGGQSTRNDKNGKKENAIEAPNNPSLNAPKEEEEPSAFALTGFTLSDKFSNIDDSIETIVDKNYNWDYITNEGVEETPPAQQNVVINKKEEKKNSLPSIEELMQQRDREILVT